MCVPPPAVRSFSGGVSRHAASAALSDASERASSGKKRPRVAPARDTSSTCLTKAARSRSSVVTAAGMKVEVLTVGGEMSSQEFVKKRLASELDALRSILKNAELISRRGACKGGAPAAGNKERFLASNQRAKPIEEDSDAALAKRSKISTLVEQKQEQIPAPRMSPEERDQLARRLSSLCGELPGHIAVFLQKQFGDADTHGEIEINMDSVQDSVLFELKTRLDKFAEESRDNDKIAEGEESKGEVVAQQEDQEHIDICSLSPSVETGNMAESSSSSDDSDSDSSGDSDSESSGDSDSDNDDSGSESDSDQSKDTSARQPSEPASGTAQSTAQAESSVSGESIGVPALPTVAPQSVEAKNAQDVQRAAAPKTVPLAGLIYKANLRRQLLEMERTVLPDQRIDPRDLQRLRIAEYGHPRLMRQLGLVLKVVEV